MFRNVFRLFVVVVLGLVVRQVVLWIVRSFSTVTPQPVPRAAASGELKEDPVCGTFIAVASSIKRNVDGQVIHFCSTTCRDRYGVV